tara:strand:- start:709 stop:897 length:189 start_codon:yes stop_codon:yes gene_type:complete
MFKNSFAKILLNAVKADDTDGPQNDTIRRYIPYIDNRLLYLAITADFALWGALAYFGYHHFT